MPRNARLNNPTLNTTARRCTLALVMLFVLSAGLPAAATVYNNRNPDNPDNINDPWKEDIATEVGIIEKLNSPVPLDLMLIDKDGNEVELASFFKAGRPVVFNLGYGRCPVICPSMRSQLAKTIGEAELELGKDFVVLNISIDPNETPEMSRQQRERTLKELGDNGYTGSTDGWHYLTASPTTIQTLTEAVGYRYLYIPPQDEYGHPGVLILADGQGTVRRYLSGTAYSGRTLRLSVVETSEGKVGSMLDRAFVTCFAWDPDANNYTATAKFIMMLGGGVMIIVAIGGLYAGFAYEKRRRQLGLTGQDGPPSGGPSLSVG